MDFRKSAPTIIEVPSGNTNAALDTVIAAITSKKFPVVVGLAGGSCCGKSFFSKKLNDFYNEKITVFPLDEFQLGENFPAKDSSLYRWDDPNNFAPEQAGEAFEKLKQKGSCSIPHFDLAKNIRVGEREIQRRDVIVLEGLYPLSDPLIKYVDVGVYFEAPYYVRFLRRIFRFTAEMGAELAAIPVKHMLSSVNAAHGSFVSRQRESADFIVRVRYSFETETAIAFGLNNYSLDMPIGPTAWSIELPEDIRISISTSQEVSSLFVSWQNRLVFKAPIERRLVEQIHHVDWFSY